MLAEVDELLTAEHRLRAIVAERHAWAADQASKSGDVAGMTRATDKLLEVLDTLPVRAARGGESASGVGNERARVLELLDSPPTVGNSADA